MSSVAVNKHRLGDRWLGFICLATTSAGWALNFTAVKVLIREWPPLFSRGIAGIAASAALAVFAACLGEKLTVSRDVFPRLLFAAFTNVFALMGFATLSLNWLGVGESLLLIYTIPIWSTLFAWPLLGLRPTTSGIVSLLLGIGGVAVLLSAQKVSFDAGQLWGILLALASAILFAVGTVLNGNSLPLPFVVSTAWQVGLGCVPLLFLGLAFEHPVIGALTTTGAWIMVYMAFVSMGICYMTWFATLRFLPPTTAATGLFLVPLIGVLSAALLLGEPLGRRQILAVALVLGGVALALRSKQPT